MKIKSILFALVISILFTTSVYAVPIYNNEEPVVDIAPKAYKRYAIPYEPYMYADRIGINYAKLEEHIGEKAYWRYGKKNQYYAVFKADETHYLFMNYVRMANEPDGWYASKFPSKALFEKYVKKGTELDIVKLIDQDTMLVRFGRLGITVHRFSDGSLWVFYYLQNDEEKWIVSDIKKYDEDPAKTVNNLIDIDYNLIQKELPNEEEVFLQKLKEHNEWIKEDKLVALHDKLGINVIRKKWISDKQEKTKIKRIKRKKKSINIKIRKVKEIFGYQVELSTSRKFKKAKRTIFIKDNKKTNIIIKRIKKNKNYYLRVRTVSKVDFYNKKHNVYSKWSDVYELFNKRIVRIKK